MSFRINTSHHFQPNENKSKLLFLFLFLLAMPVIIYFFFHKWKTGTIYGDDLFVFKSHSEANGVGDKLNLPVLYGKYRPIHGIGIHFLIESFKKNLEGYYLFNIGVQSINAILFALSVNLFFRNFFLSLVFSLIIGLSSFSLFSITQLFNGGALEGLAMTFFLASLYFIVKALYRRDYIPLQKANALLWAIIFANISMYTHERYVVMLAFISFILFLSPSFKEIKLRQKIFLTLLAIVSIILNIGIKKYIYAMPFLMGTASTSLEFSFSTALSFFGEAILSILRINSGPEYLIGFKFFNLPVMYKIIIGVLAGTFIIAIMFYLVKVIKRYANKQEQAAPDLYNFLFLIGLFGLVLMPAILTIRLEQRWLLAPFSIFALIVAIALNSFFEFKRQKLKYVSVTVVACLLITVEYTYLEKGSKNLYLVNSEKIGSVFKEAMVNGTIRPGTDKLYVWQKQNDDNTNRGIRWSLGDGYIFNFYQGKTKELSFVDSVYEKARYFSDSSFINFNTRTDQFIYIKLNDSASVWDITRNYLNDTLKQLSSSDLNDGKVNRSVSYNQNYLKITNQDVDKFAIEGLHQNENGASWTNGNVSFSLLGDFLAEDSLIIQLNTYMPPACKNIVPRVSIIGLEDKAFYPVVMQREGDNFSFKFYLEKATFIQKIKITSDVIKATPPDQRKLSFPFISMEIKKHR